MKIKPGFSLHELGDECIVIHDGTTNINFDKLLSLNPTAAFLWKAVGSDAFDAETLTRLLTDYYEVSREKALHDAQLFMKHLVEAGVAD